MSMFFSNVFNSNIMFNHGELNGMLIGMELLITLNGLQSASEMVYFRICFSSSVHLILINKMMERK